MKHTQSAFLQLCLLVLVCTAQWTTAKAAKAKAAQKNVRLFNEADVGVDVFWVHPQEGSIHKMTGDSEIIGPGMNIDLKSFAGHEFEIHEVGACDNNGDKTCRRVIFEVNENDDQSTLYRIVLTIWFAWFGLVCLLE